MTDFEKEEFRKALGRLYDSTVELREFAERGARRQQALDESLELLTHNVQGLTQIVQYDSENIGLLTQDVRELSRNVREDGENIRALARIAEIHDRRISQIEGDATP